MAEGDEVVKLKSSQNRSNDVVLSVGGVNFKCQRQTLTHFSPYFRAMFSHNFSESDKSIIEIQDVDPDAMRVLLQYIQTDEVPREFLLSHNVLSLLQASRMLQFECVQNMCISVIVHEWLNVDTCLQTLVTAKELDLISLCRKAKALAFWEFSKVKSSAAFFELTIEALEEYLANDGLNVRQGEFEVFDAGLSWLQEDPKNRKQHILRILRCICFSDICAADIGTMFLYPNVTEDPQILHALKCVLALKASSNQKLESSAVPSDEQVIISKECEKETVELKNDQSDLKSLNEDSELHRPSCYKRIRHCKCLAVNETSEPNTHRTDSSDLVKDMYSSSPEQNTICFCCNIKSDTDKVKSRSKSCNSESSDKTTMPENKMPVKTPSDCVAQYDSQTIDTAVQLLSKPSRTLPQVPCVIGHVVDKESNKIRKLVRPYVLYFDEKKSEQLIPFLHLVKVNEGPVEPTGYKVINKGQELYVIGGEYLLGYGNWNNTVWKYTLWKEEWTFETSLTSPRRHHSLCFIDDDIYLIGGFGRHRVIMDAVEKYSISSKIWTRCAPLPSAMYSAACCIHKGDIYVFGVQVCYYKIKMDTWYCLGKSPMSRNVTFNCAMSHGDWIYLTGPYSSELLRFDPRHVSMPNETDSAYHLLGSFTHRTSSTCLSNNKIYSFSTDELGQTFIEEYNIKQNRFSVLWKKSECEENGVSDFSPNNCIGCFSMIMY